MGYQVVPYAEKEKMALAVAKSGLFGCKTPEQALTLMLIAECEGVPVMQAVLDYHIIDNKPSLKSDAMLRRFQASGGIIKWIERSDKKVSAQFSHPSCPEPVVVDWDMDRAEKAKLSNRVYKSGEPNMWQKFPRQMLTARVISEGIRATAPGAASGVYTPEEVMDFSDKPAEVVKVEPAKHDPVQEAQIVQEKNPISQKTLDKFAMAKSLLGDDEFRKVLMSRHVEAVCDIQDEEEAKFILREMRVAFESKTRMEGVAK